MLTAVAAIFVFGLLVMAHEAGHLVVAKWVGVKVHEFSMGFGPRLWGTRWGDTVYNIRALPLGGFVRMAGMDDDDRDSEGSFNRKTVGQRIWVIVAGPFMNLVLAVALFITVFTVLGIPSPVNENVVGEIVSGTPAERAGLQAGDRIVMVDSKSTPTWEEMTTSIRAAKEKPIKLEIERNQGRFSVTLTPELNGQNYMIGVRAQIQYYRMGVIQGISEGFQQTVSITGQVIGGIMHINPKELAGPVGIVKTIGDTAENGLSDLLLLAGILSINLAVLNLLPIPALDGSRVVFMLLEKLRGRPVDPEREGMIHLIGFALLMVLILVITYQDILKLIV